MRTFIGMDLGSKDGDWSVEVEYKRLHDGTVVVTDMRRWQHTIELEAARAELSNLEKPE